MYYQQFPQNRHPHYHPYGYGAYQGGYGLYGLGQSHGQGSDPYDPYGNDVASEHGTATTGSKDPFENEVAAFEQEHQEVEKSHQKDTPDSPFDLVQQQLDLANRMANKLGGLDDVGRKRLARLKIEGTSPEIIKIVLYVEKWRPYFYAENGDPLHQPPAGGQTIWQGLNELAKTKAQRQAVHDLGFPMTWTAPGRGPEIRLPAMTIRNRKIAAKTPPRMKRPSSAAGWTTGQKWAYGGAAAFVAWLLWRSSTKKQRRFRRTMKTRT